MMWGSMLPNISRCVFTHVSNLLIVYSETIKGHQDISSRFVCESAPTLLIVVSALWIAACEGSYPWRL